MTSPHLTIIYGELTEYDKANGNRPFAGSPGDLFIHRTFDVLRPANYTNDETLGLDIRVVSDPVQMRRPYTSGTRILALGQPALAALGFEPRLNKLRGICLSTPANHPVIATYHPIDCWTMRRASNDESDDDPAEESKDVGPTKRQNYLHWAMLDYTKLMTMPWPLPSVLQPTNTIPQTADHTVQLLDSIQQFAVIDIETRRQDHSLDCIGFFTSGRAFVIPFYTYNDTRYFSKPGDFGRVWRALIRLFSRRDVLFIGHNLAFDLSVLCFHYNLPLPRRLYDTMIAMHREYPQLEKSLSHALSLYTHATRNHKADIALNNSPDNLRRLIQYNANDCFWTYQVFAEQRRRAAGNPALDDAVRLGNDTLYATLMISLTGACVDTEALAEQRQFHQQRADQLTRVLKILTDNPNFNPDSPKQLEALFYARLAYPIEEVTDTGSAATDAGTIYKLQLKQSNPLFPIIIAAKEASKAASMLGFKLKETR